MKYSFTQLFEKKLKKKMIYLLICLFLILKIPTLNVPYFWDETTSIRQCLSVANKNLYPIPDYDVGHPPLFYFIGGLMYKLFGESPVVSRLIILFFSILGIYFTYLIGKELYDEKVGLLAAALLMFSPLYFAQSGIFVTDTPLTALILSTVYFVIKNDEKKYIISSSLMVLMKEPGILAVFAILIYMIANNYKRKKVLFKKVFIYSIPLLVFLIWTIYHWSQAGWIIYKPENYNLYRIQEGADIKLLLLDLAKISNFIFMLQYRFIISLIITILIIYSYGKIRKTFKKEVLLLFLLILFYVVAFSLAYSIARYFLPVLPFFFIIGSKAIVEIIPKKVIIPIILLIIILFITDWFGTRDVYAGQILESNLEYLDVIKSNEMAIDYLVKNYPDSIIFAGLQISYDKVPLKIISFDAYKFENASIDDVNIVLFPHQSSSYPLFSQTISKMNLSLLKKFEVNGKITEIFKVIK